MGRGDKRTRKGKIFKGSFGNSRPQKVKKTTTAEATKPAPAKKTAKPKKALTESSETKTAKRAPAKKAAAAPKKKTDSAE